MSEVTIETYTKGNITVSLLECPAIGRHYLPWVIRIQVDGDHWDESFDSPITAHAHFRDTAKQVIGQKVPYRSFAATGITFEFDEPSVDPAEELLSELVIALERLGPGSDKIPALVARYVAMPLFRENADGIYAAASASPFWHYRLVAREAIAIAEAREQQLQEDERLALKTEELERRVVKLRDLRQKEAAYHDNATFGLF